MWGFFWRRIEALKNRRSQTKASYAGISKKFTLLTFRKALHLCPYRRCRCLSLRTPTILLLRIILLHWIGRLLYPSAWLHHLKEDKSQWLPVLSSNYLVLLLQMENWRGATGLQRTVVCSSLSFSFFSSAFRIVWHFLAFKILSMKSTFFPNNCSTLG